MNNSYTIVKSHNSWRFSEGQWLKYNLFFIGSGFSSQHLHDISQSSVTPFIGDPISSSNP